MMKDHNELSTDEVQLTTPSSGEQNKSVKLLMGACILFTCIDAIFTLAVISTNHDAKHGSDGASFIAIWSCFLLILFVIVGSITVFRRGSSPLTVGIIIGLGAMLTQLFFILMFFYFVFAKHADNYDEGADNAMGTICLFNTMVFGAFTAMFVIHREGYIIHSGDAPIASGGVSENPMQPSTKISSSDHGSEDEPEETF